MPAWVQILLVLLSGGGVLIAAKRAVDRYAASLSPEERAEHEDNIRDSRNDW